MRAHKIGFDVLTEIVGNYDPVRHDLRQADPKTNPFHKCDSCIPKEVSVLTPIFAKRVEELKLQGFSVSEIENILNTAIYRIINNLFHGGKPRMM